ncbi:hypothetical protein BN1723_010236 [Verticillium longisporum]|uniref:Uncharacterized protein n=1 Tax=Verticillium longisporum TaxID=100787 RepID=A0A0G4M6J5_VERLO|nr:hypothetical protein BN1723_010236 [Verticillium longisporum]CRK29908.1 hypothetical protein BN1708_005047 [Verticillium longisporum]
MDALSTALPADLQALRDNFTVREGDREHFYRCWRNAECHKCLNVGVRPKLVPDPAAGAGVRRGHMPISRGALGDAHEAAGLPGVDHHGAYGRDLHRVDAGLPPAGRGYSVRVPPCMALG